MNTHDIKKVGAIATTKGWAHPTTGEILSAVRMTPEEVAEANKSNDSVRLEEVGEVVGSRLTMLRENLNQGFED